MFRTDRARLAIVPIALGLLVTPALAHDCNEPTVSHPSRDNIGYHDHGPDCSRLDETALIRERNELQDFLRNSDGNAATIAREKVERIDKILESLR